MKLKTFGTKLVTLKFIYPAGLTGGNYNIVATANATATGDASAQVVSAARVAVSQPTVDLATTFASTHPVAISPGKGDNANITITNNGNVTAIGDLSLKLYASADQTLDLSDTLLAAITGRKFTLRAGKSITLHVHFAAPAGMAAGSYSLIASTQSSTTPADGNAGNDVAVAATV